MNSIIEFNSRLKYAYSIIREFREPIFNNSLGRCKAIIKTSRVFQNLYLGHKAKIWVFRIKCLNVISMNCLLLIANLTNYNVI